MEVRKYFELNQNEKITAKFMRAAKAVLRGKFIASNVYIRKQEMTIYASVVTKK